MTAPFYYPNGKPFICESCNAPVGQTQERFWDRDSKRKFCFGCGKDRGGEVKMKEERGKPTEGRLAEASTANKEDKTLSYTPYAYDDSRSPIIDGGAMALNHCDCGHSSYAPVIQRLSDWSTVTLCRDCDWLVTAQFKLKMLGVWRPVAKPLPVEAKA